MKILPRNPRRRITRQKQSRTRYISLLPKPLQRPILNIITILIISTRQPRKPLSISNRTRGNTIHNHVLRPQLNSQMPRNRVNPSLRRASMQLKQHPRIQRRRNINNISPMLLKIQIKRRLAHMKRPKRVNFHHRLKRIRRQLIKRRQEIPRSAFQLPLNIYHSQVYPTSQNAKLHPKPTFRNSNNSSRPKSAPTRHFSPSQIFTTPPQPIKYFSPFCSQCTPYNQISKTTTRYRSKFLLRRLL